MSGIENLKNRLDYRGGEAQLDRMKDAKVVSLKRALHYSYQSATAILKDGREFRCLINPDKLKTSADDKIISIPFEDKCLNAKKCKCHSKEERSRINIINMKPGDVFTWKETRSHWLVYLQRLEETAYFRAEIRRCKYELCVNGKHYKVFARKKDLGDIPWKTTKDTSFNELDYSLELYITKDRNTKDYFKRFDVIELNGQPWEVQATDAMSVDGIVMVALKEYYQNTIEKKVYIEKIKEEQLEPEIDIQLPYIKGDKEVYPYDIKTYTIENMEGGNWSLDSKKAMIVESDETTAKVEVVTGRSGEFELKYIKENEKDVILKITINSL